MVSSTEMSKNKLKANSHLVAHQKNLAELFLQGMTYQQHGMFKEAQTIYEKILTIQVDNFDALHLLGTIFAQTGNYLKALNFLSKAITINSKDSSCYNNLGNVLMELERLEDALFSYDKAICINSNYTEAYSNRGIVLLSLKRLDEAIVSVNKAISLNPHFTEAYSTRGSILLSLERFDEAIVSVNKAISLNPYFTEAYITRGNILLKLKCLDEALSNYDKAISISPNYAEAYWNSSMCYLLKGDFKVGWRRYEWRSKIQSLNKMVGIRHFSKPLWLGAELLKDKTILLYAEQGLGDTIQFSRYVQLVLKLGGKVILEVQPSLVKLLTKLEAGSIVLAIGEKLPHCDYQCPLMSLPLAFKTELHTIPLVQQQIESDKDKLFTWQIKLGEKKKPRVGIVWSGSSIHSNDQNRSISLSKLIKNLPTDFEYVSLQKEVRDVDKEVLTEHSEIHHFGDHLEDFSDTAALCELMDLVISVDTSIAHLAATLGKTTWVMLPFVPDWRWLLDRNDSPWYPSIKLYRQEKSGDWDGVLATIKSALKASL